MNATPEATFEAEIARYETAIKQTEAKLIRISWVRLAVFVAATVLEIMSWSWGGAWWLLVIAGFLLVFGVVVKWYQRVEREKRFQEEVRKINQEELNRLAHQLDGLEGGAEFTSRDHLYNSDLDIFGPRSLFAYLNRGTTAMGKSQLAQLLNEGLPRTEIQATQKRVKSIVGRLQWRQNLQAAGRMTPQAIERPDELDEWARQEPELLDKPIYRILPLVLSPVFIAVIVLGFLEIIPLWTSLVWLVGHYLINRTIGKYGQRVYQETESRADALKAYADLFHRIEQELTEDEELKVTMSGLKNETGATASEEIRKLSRIFSSLELRLNGFPYFIMQQLFFWDMVWIRRLEAWKRDNRLYLMHWLSTLGLVETYSSLAALSFAHPDWTWPEIPEEGFVIEGEKVGHPLLPVEECVSNPINISRKGLIWLITGSNMSGKSTYLRTVGVNAVLALAGAPVCAESFRITPMKVVTSMRSIDSLEESTSSFYAELKRLKMVIQQVESGGSVLFLLDEILKGTNSRDRHAGARALIRQLQSLGGSGLVSTHDLELVELEREMAGDLKNYSFNCEVGEGGTLTFDYTLTDGVCESMNATALMQAMGIDM